MEIERKLHLPNAAAHTHVASLLSPHHLKTHKQHNLFFDSASNELSSRRAVLRIRFYDNEHDPCCVVSLKAKALLVDGISQGEEEIDLATGRGCVAEPEKLLEVKSRVVKRAIDEFDITKEKSGIGGIRNVRNVYDWNGLVLELNKIKRSNGRL